MLHTEKQQIQHNRFKTAYENILENMIEECGFADESPEKKLFLNTCAGIYRAISDEMTKAELIGKRQSAAPLLDTISRTERELAKLTGMLRVTAHELNTESKEFQEKVAELDTLEQSVHRELETICTAAEELLNVPCASEVPDKENEEKIMEEIKEIWGNECRELSELAKREEETRNKIYRIKTVNEMF